MSTTNLTPEAKIAIADLRSLSNLQKHPVKIHDLLRDYLEMDGQNLPYKKYGFKNPEDFLRASGEFLMIKNQGEIFVTALPSPDSAHITQMVSRQQTRKRDRRPARLPLRSDQSWNKTSFSSNVSRNLRMAPIRRMNNRSYPNNNNNNQQQQQSRNNNGMVKQNYGGGDSNNNSNQSNNRNTNSINSKQQQNMRNPIPLMDINVQLDTLDLRERINIKRSTNQQSQQQQSQEKVTQSSNSRPILGQNGGTNQNSSTDVLTFGNYLNKNGPSAAASSNIQRNNGHQTDNHNKDGEKFSSYLNTRNNRNQQNIKQKLNENERLKSMTTVPVPTGTSKISSVQNRLKITKNNSFNDNNIMPDNESSISSPKITKFQFNPNLTSLVSLAQYCTVRKLPYPNYNIGYCGKQRIQCKVNINNIIYSTYPDDFSDEESATEACAKIAIEDIKLIEEHKNRVPICMDSDCELAWKIYQELKINYPCGIIAKMFPDAFEKKFQQSLPDHWWTIIQKPDKFTLQSAAGDNFILFANIESESCTVSNASSDVEQDEYLITNQLKLPWDDKYWSLYITHCVSTAEIWARIVHKDYSEKLDSLLTDIEMAMFSDKKRAVSLIIGQFYLVCISECWSRVRLDSIDKGNGKCGCFFVDFGDNDSLAMDQLYICDKKFLELPQQAIPFSLFGLEDFAENPIAKKYIDLKLLNKGLIAEIITKRENYEIIKNDEEITTNNNDDVISKIQIVLYDTSTNDDINLNPLLLNKICDETPPPELKTIGVTNVNVTHINDNGEVYLQVKTSGLYVEELIHQLVESKFKEDQHKVSPNDMRRTNLFLIKDNDDQRWYRGCLIDNDFKSNDINFNIFYVDHGNIKNIPVTNIFRLEALSTALNKLPWQAIKTKLHNLPPINSNVVARIRGLLRINYPAIVKLAVLSLDNSKNIVPQIIAFVRIERNNSLCNVNESIRMEHELESYSYGTLEQENELEYKKFNSDSPGRSPSPTLSFNYKHLSEMSIRNIRNNTKSSSSTTTNKEQLPPKLSSNCWIPDKGEIFNVLVTISSNPFNFLIQSYNDFPKYQDMMNELQNYCKRNNEYIPSDMIKIGEAYAVLKTDLYYRATVEGIFTPDSTCVYFCDCGDVAVVPNSSIKTLPTKFRSMPKQAMLAKIHGIKPINGEWTADDSVRFRELTLNHKFASVIEDISIDDFDPKKPKVLELTLIDVSTDEDIYIDKILINENRAISTS